MIALHLNSHEILIGSQCIATRDRHVEVSSVARSLERSGKV